MTILSRSFAIACMALQLAFAMTTTKPTLGFSPQAQPSQPTQTRMSTTTTTSPIRAAQPFASSVFDQIDKEGKGKITADQLRDYLVEIGPYTDAVARSIFERLDIHRNGHLKLEELARGVREHNLFRTGAVPSIKVPSPVIGSYVKLGKRRQKEQDRKKQLYHQQAKRFFEALEITNHDGYLSLEQLREHFLLKRMEAVALESLQGSSSGDKKRRRRHQSSGRTAWKYSEAHLLKVFRIVDTDDDGRFSQRDLREAFFKHPSVRHSFRA